MLIAELLAPTLDEWKLRLSEHQYQQLAVYADELQRWNERVNLTAITDLPGIATRHFLDSLACALPWSEPPPSLCDIGTGAGFPGLVLKILWPDTRLLLADSVGKKTAFLQHMVEQLTLQRVEIVTARAETLGRDPRYREQFAAGVARALAPLGVLAEYCLPLVAVGGRLVAPKGALSDAEVVAARRAIGQLGGRIIAVEPVQLPHVEGHRLIAIDKVAPTPSHLPRPVGVPSKRPL